MLEQVYEFLNNVILTSNEFVSIIIDELNITSKVFNYLQNETLNLENELVVNMFKIIKHLLADKKKWKYNKEKIGNIIKSIVLVIKKMNNSELHHMLQL